MTAQDAEDALMVELQERLRDVAHQLNPSLLQLGDPSREIGVLRGQVDAILTSVMQLAIIIQGLRNPTTDEAVCSDPHS